MNCWYTPGAESDTAVWDNVIIFHMHVLHVSRTLISCKKLTENLAMGSDTCRLKPFVLFTKSKEPYNHGSLK